MQQAFVIKCQPTEYWILLFKCEPLTVVSIRSPEKNDDDNKQVYGFPVSVVLTHTFNIYILHQFIAHQFW